MDGKRTDSALAPPPSSGLPRELNPDRVKEACRILAPLAAAFPDAKVSEATALVYASRLAKYEPAILEEAVMRAIDTAKRFPPISRLKELANQVLEERRGRVPMLTAQKPSPKDVEEVRRMVRRISERLSFSGLNGGSDVKRTGKWRARPALHSIVSEGVDEKRWAEIVEKQRKLGIG